VLSAVTHRSGRGRQHESQTFRLISQELNRKSLRSRRRASPAEKVRSTERKSEMVSVVTPSCPLYVGIDNLSSGREEAGKWLKLRLVRKGIYDSLQPRPEGFDNELFEEMRGGEWEGSARRPKQRVRIQKLF
jgi:hypothetical protein